MYRRQSLSAGRVPWQRLSCDWSMVSEDETVFLHQRGNQRLRYDAYNVGDDTLIFDSTSPVILDSVSGGGGGGGGGVSGEMIAEEIGKRVVEEARRNDEEGIGMCVVCQDQLDLDLDGRRIRIARLDCGHQFHPRCIQKWLCRKNNCPLCKATALHLPSSNLQI